MQNNTCHTSFSIGVDLNLKVKDQLSSFMKIKWHLTVVTAETCADSSET